MFMFSFMQYGRKREEAAKVLQAWCRGNIIRKIVFDELRIECDLLLSQLKLNQSSSMEVVGKIISILVKIYLPSKDFDRMVMVYFVYLRNALCV